MHLAEMESAIEALYAEPEYWREKVIALENRMYKAWLLGVEAILLQDKVAA